MKIGMSIVRKSRIAVGVIGGEIHSAEARDSIGLFVRVIAGTHKRARLNVAETQAERLFFQISELVRRIKAGDRKMIARRPQVLAYRENVNAPLGQITENVN